MNEIGKRIDKKCNDLKITTVELSELSGVNYKTLHRIMNAENANPTIDNMKLISLSLGTSIDSLVSGENMEDDEEMGIILKDLKTLSNDDKKRILYMVRMMVAESKARNA